MFKRLAPLLLLIGSIAFLAPTAAAAPVAPTDHTNALNQPDAIMQQDDGGNNNDNGDQQFGDILKNLEDKVIGWVARIGIIAVVIGAGAYALASKNANLAERGIHMMWGGIIAIGISAAAAAIKATINAVVGVTVLPFF